MCNKYKHVKQGSTFCRTTKRHNPCKSTNTSTPADNARSRRKRPATTAVMMAPPSPVWPHHRHAAKHHCPISQPGQQHIRNEKGGLAQIPSYGHKLLKLTLRNTSKAHRSIDQWRMSPLGSSPSCRESCCACWRGCALGPPCAGGSTPNRGCSIQHAPCLPRRPRHGHHQWARWTTRLSKL